MCRTEKRANQTTSTLHYKHLIVFLVGFLSEESGFLELVLKCVHTLLIGQRPVLEHLAGTASNDNFSMMITPELSMTIHTCFHRYEDLFKGGPLEDMQETNTLSNTQSKYFLLELCGENFETSSTLY